MTEVVICKHGEWFTVSVENRIYEHGSGTYVTQSHPISALRSLDEARDLRDTLRKVASGDLQQEVVE